MFTTNNGNYEKKEPLMTTETVIGPSVRVEGTLNSAGNINIEGQFKGVIKIEQKLNIGKEAKIEAQVNAGSAFIAGELIGNITVIDRLELSSSAKIKGDVTAKILVVEAGAALNGRCHMGQPSSKPVKEVQSTEPVGQNESK